MTQRLLWSVWLRYLNAFCSTLLLLIFSLTLLELALRNDPTINCPTAACEIIEDAWVFSLHILTTTVILTALEVVKYAKMQFNKQILCHLDDDFTTRFGVEFWKSLESVVGVLTHVNLQSCNVHSNNTHTGMCKRSQTFYCHCVK